MFTQWFVSNPRLLVMSIVLIVIAGVTSFQALPRMEDPVLTARFAMATSAFPGATPDRVEALVSKSIEQQLSDVKEIHELTSISRNGVSIVVIELNEDLKKDQVSTTWGVIRERLNAAHSTMPELVTKPQLKEIDAKANVILVGLRWDSAQPPSYSILRRLAKRLQDRLDQIPGTEKTELYGDPTEEFIVEVEREKASSLGINASQIAQVIAGNDTKLPAGRMQGNTTGLTLEVTGNLDTTTRLNQVPIRNDLSGTIVQLGDIAQVSRTIRDPAPAKALIHGQPAIVIGSQLVDSYRIDYWRKDAEQILAEFKEELPLGLKLDVIFDQYPYVQSRFESLAKNFLIGLISVCLCTAVWMNLRSAVLVGIMLPLNCLLILPVMLVAGIPLHQMSVSGLVIAMGMLVDNAIVVVDHIDHQISRGRTVLASAIDASKTLAVPLVGATMTTVFSFAPIALMPGATGEFVGSIAMVTMITVLLSYGLSLTVIPGLSVFVARPSDNQYNWLTNPKGLSERFYRAVLAGLLRFPMFGAVATASVSFIGFASIFSLQDQFFPPADRNQFHIEMDLPANASMQETEQLARQVRDVALRDEAVEELHWFIGESAPVFYYNVVTARSNQPSYGQAIVQCRSPQAAHKAMLRLQPILSNKFPQANIVVRQLEQGPPFAAPVEIRLSGADLDVLSSLASKVRLVLSQTLGVVSTRCELEEIVTKGKIDVLQNESYLAGYDLTTIATALNDSLEGVVGGTILEGTEEVPVRVRMANSQRSDLNQIISMELQRSAIHQSQSHQGLPLSAITSLALSSDVGAILRIDRTRCAEVYAYLPAGLLPSIVLADFQERLAESGFKLPPGYNLKFYGAAGEQQQAVGNLMVYASVMGAALVATLVLILNSFRLAALVGLIALLSTSFSLWALDLADLPFGFMAIVGMVGMLGVAVNDSILMLTSLSRNQAASAGDKAKVIDIAADNSRHILVTSITTIAGFFPLYLDGGDFWPPTAITVSMGVAGATYFALFFVPCAYLVMQRIPSLSTFRQSEVSSRTW